MRQLVFVRKRKAIVMCTNLTPKMILLFKGQTRIEQTH
jgi:hypothetical protein